MRITPSNVGDIIRLDFQPGHILIESVSEAFVFYRKENGDRHSSFEHEVAGSVLRDEARAAEFRRNVKLGSALNHAEYRAVCSLLSADLTHEQRADANSVLETVKSMQRNLRKRIMEQDQRDVGNPPRSLNALILRATENAQTQQSQATQPPHYYFDAER